MSWFFDVWQTLLAEFSDLPDARAITQVIVRLTLAGILGGVLGYEREARGKSAGVRTHMLVAIGAALFVLVPRLSGVDENEMTRVLQGLVAGIGFLGAGAIVKGESASKVEGMTTAAGIWLCAGVGVAAGMGREATAVLSTAVALLVLTSEVRVSGFLKKKQDDDAKPDDAKPADAKPADAKPDDAKKAKKPKE